MTRGRKVKRRALKHLPKVQRGEKKFLEKRIGQKPRNVLKSDRHSLEGGKGGGIFGWGEADKGYS